MIIRKIKEILTYKVDIWVVLLQAIVLGLLIGLTKGTCP